MEHVQIAYYLIVIVIGFVVLAMAGFWFSKTREADLINFCILYALFTLFLILSVLKKYLLINVDGYSAQSWYVILGISQALNFWVLVASIHFILGFHQLPYKNSVTALFFLATLICLGLILSPFGTVLDIDSKAIQFGIGHRIAAIWYVVSFTIVLAFGFGFLKNLQHSDKRNFMIGLLIFASVGYLETLIGLPLSLFGHSVNIVNENDGFLFSSIPYSLYGIFLIRYFLSYPIPIPLAAEGLSAEFIAKYKITDREHEIILKVVQGKSNSVIATELFISLATVKTHLHNIYKKIGVESRYDLLARVRSGQ
jgi:DNA-binding CsgD family transcriptional regulator